MSYSEERLRQIWEKGTPIPGKQADTWRKDKCGATMQRSAYGDTDSSHGWEVDHIVPEARGGSDHLSNLQPLQWENNRAKADNYPNWTCAKTS